VDSTREGSQQRDRDMEQIQLADYCYEVALNTRNLPVSAYGLIATVILCFTCEPARIDRTRRNFEADEA